jgi:hypothetical protein
MVVFAIVALAYARGHWNGIYDDAFIYLRYVRNLDNGCGLRFNCSGPPVEGFTSPLFLAVLWFGSVFSHRLIDSCQVTGVAFLIAAGAFSIATAATLVRDRGPWLASAAVAGTCAVLACDDYVLLNGNIGLETSLAALTISIVAYAAVTERPRLLTAATIAVCLGRPEATLFAVALPMLPWMRRAKYLVPIAVSLVGVEIARLAIFGSVLPNTYYAKSGGTWRHVELGLAYVVETARDFPLTFGAPLALYVARCRRSVAFVLVVAGAWLLFFLRVGGDTFPYSRLWFPFVPSLAALAMAGTAAALERFNRRLDVAGVVLIAVVFSMRAALAHAIPPQGVNQRIVDWAAAGSYLRNHYPRGTLVAVVPIGAIGYYSSLPILDLVGLTDETIARSGNSVPTELLQKNWIAHERNDTAYVLRRAPGVIVTTSIRDVPWTLEDARAGFWADWLLLEEIKRGAAPYRVVNAEIQAHRYMLMFERTADSAR